MQDGEGLLDQGHGGDVQHGEGLLDEGHRGDVQDSEGSLDQGQYDDGQQCNREIHLSIHFLPSFFNP
jgi:hypothetical protein